MRSRRHGANRPSRRSVRLPGYDYSAAGAYFITVCTFRRECLFGEIRRGVMQVNEAGAIVARAWRDIVNRAAHLTMDAWIVMPDHFHGLLIPAQSPRIPSDIEVVAWRAAQGRPARLPGCNARLAGPAPRSLGAIVGAFKSASSRAINYQRHSPGAPVWQRGYYERIIGDEAALDAARQYIANNPLNWRG